MRLRLLAILTVSAVGLGPASRAPAEVITKDTFPDLLKKVQAASQTWGEGEPNDPIYVSLYTLSYNEESLEMLRTTLGGLSGENAAYVAGRLLAPVVMSDTEIARKALPYGSTARNQFTRYLPMPAYSKGDLKSLELPPKLDPRASAEAQLKMLGDYAEKRQRKMDAEGKVLRANMQSVDLERIVFQIMVHANLPAEDEKVLDAVFRLEREKKAQYQSVLRAIREEASRMDQAHAARLYAGLDKLLKALQYTEANYVNQADIRLGTTENSTFAMPHLYPGFDIATVMNVLAPIAKQPAVPVLTGSEISVTNQLNAAKWLLSRNRIPEGRTALEGIRTQHRRGGRRLDPGAEKVVQEVERLLKALPAPSPSPTTRRGR